MSRNERIMPLGVKSFHLNTHRQEKVVYIASSKRQKWREKIMENNYTIHKSIVGKCCAFFHCVDARAKQEERESKCVGTSHHNITVRSFCARRVLFTF